MCLDLLSMGYLQIARDNAGLAQPKITLADRKKLSKWTNSPDDDLYLQHKDVFDNRNYYNQKTGEPIWPGQNGNCHKDGFLNGIYVSDNLKPGKIIDRYGGNTGTFFGDEGTPIENRAMEPNSDFSSYNKYEVLKELPVKQGTIAPWFGQPGGGIQYQLEPKFVDSIKAILGPKKDLIDGLIDFGYLKRL